MYRDTCLGKKCSRAECIRQCFLEGLIDAM
ncbi:hypothetical protein [Agrobacterium sp. NPDC090273]